MSDTIEIFERVLKELKDEKQATGAMTAQRLHGINGLFNGPGYDQVVFSTYVRPKSIGSMLPMIPSVDEDPRFATLTGFTAPSGDQPTNACADAPTGYTKGCELTAYFGLKRFDTQEIEMDQVMRRVNRGDFKDLRLAGEILNEDLRGALAPGGITQDNALNVLTAMEMLRTAAYMENALAIDMWQGTVAGGSFPGLAAQIATGQVDAATGTACPSLDSDIKDFALNEVCGTGLDIVEYLSALMYYLDSLATDTGLAPVRWVLVMRPQLWHELSKCWPCRYNTSGCTVLDTNAIDTVPQIDAAAMTQERDMYRRDMRLPVNGVWYDVVTDTGIHEYNNANNANLDPGEFASTIYAVPMTVTGGYPVTYREYVDYRAAAPDEAFLRGMQSWFHTDNGAYSWSYDAVRWCYVLSLKTEQRVVLRTPQLAGAIQNVKYSPLQHVRESDFTSPYHVDGGISLRDSGTRYSVWFPGGGR